VNSDRKLSVLIPLLRPIVKDRKGATRRRHFEVVPVPPRRVLFLGDSITEAGLWSDLFPELPTTNRGIGGEATYDLAERVDGASNDPIAVSLLIGTNDLHGPRELRDLRQVAARHDEIVARIRELAPDARLLVNGLLPRTLHFRGHLQTLNEWYAASAARHGATYVDTWPTFADESGVIRPEYSRDGLHLTPVGYLAWADLLRPHLASLAG
jgi:lysophospholipase L1-like esterase